MGNEIFLDTSIVIGWILENEPSHKNCEEILQAIKTKKHKILLSVFNISEIFYALQRNRFTLTRIKEIVVGLHSLPNIQIAKITSSQCIEGIKLAEKYSIDLTDAITYILMKKYQIKEIYSLDK
ncbi:MAG: type II toxin-antitoxin system VapC family toxin, partial [Candidatus Diapherotrites archaeon]|nr:type II toxin-antitoxin system VapC family toxin [Candidatus Diapherotrites archaeon]